MKVTTLSIIFILLLLPIVFAELPSPPKTPVENGEGIETIFQPPEIIIVDIPVEQPVVQQTPVPEEPVVETFVQEIPKAPIIETSPVVVEQKQTSYVAWYASAFLILTIIASLFLLNRKKAIPQQKLLDPSLLSVRNYVVENMQHGYSKQQITQTMVQHGYSQKTIDEVMNHV